VDSVGVEGRGRRLDEVSRGRRSGKVGWCSRLGRVVCC